MQSLRAIIFRTLLALAGCVPLPSRAQTPPAWAPWTSPAALARLDAGAVPVERSSFCSANCRYDRYGSGSESLSDNPQPRRLLYPMPNGDAVIYDDPGAGVVTRLWLTVPAQQAACLRDSVRVHLYFGASPGPQIDLPLADLFNGSTLPFAPPLVADAANASGGYVSHVPLPYVAGLRVALAGLDAEAACSGGQPLRLWYQLDAQHLPPGMVTADFSLATDWPALRTLLGADGDDPWRRDLPVQTVAATLVPGGRMLLASRDGSGWLAVLRLDLAPSAWPHVRLVVRVDGDTTVDMPLSRLFGVDAGDLLPPRSPLFGVDGTTLYSWWPMPWRRHLELALVADGLQQDRPVRAQLAWQAAPVAPSAGLLRVDRSDQCGEGSDHQLTLLAARGQGKLVALAGRYRSANGIDPDYLEGDVRVRLDGAVAPAWQGSGLEDFYNGGFYFSGGAYRQPWSGASQVDASGESAMWRLLLTEAPGYASGLTVWQESGAEPAQPLAVCVDTVAWRYALAQRALVPLPALQVGDASSEARHAYQPADGARCEPLEALFANAAASSRRATVCRYAGGYSRFHIRLPEPSAVLRLRRTLDAAQPGQAARIVVNGATAGWFPPVRPDTVRRWQQQDAPLAVAPGTTELDFEIRPLWGAHGDSGHFSESAYQLWVVPGDLLFSDGFDRVR
ncbi:MAG TPA: DUF2961 domain-containing protein [Rhodanobacteraceae bacterium]|nr:DUF2961 domain-containing protein [Rhodanobacteraceae bacterium]